MLESTVSIFSLFTFDAGDEGDDDDDSLFCFTVNRVETVQSCFQWELVHSQ